MEQQRAPEVVIALYDGLADAEAAMDDLEGVGVPYPDIRMGTHTPNDSSLPPLGAISLPDRFWSLTVVIDQRGVYHAEDILRKRGPIAIGRMPAPNAGRSDTDLGALAWRHYVFETPAATSDTDGAGTTGMTGVISSGVYATGALVEGNPPVRGLPAGEQQGAVGSEKPEA